MKRDLEVLVECCGLAPLSPSATERELIEYVSENYWLNFVWGHPQIYDFNSFDFEKLARDRYEKATAV